MKTILALTLLISLQAQAQDHNCDDLIAAGKGHLQAVVTNSDLMSSKISEALLATLEGEFEKEVSLKEQVAVLRSRIVSDINAGTVSYEHARVACPEARAERIDRVLEVLRKSLAEL